MAGLFDAISGIGSAATGFKIASDMRDMGAEAANKMGDLSNQLQDDTGFRGFGVTTGLGSSTVDEGGSMNLGVGQSPEMMQLMQMMQAQGGGYNQAANQAMQNSMMDTAAREDEIYKRAMAMQNPALDRAQAAQMAREYAMGRGGVRGSQFGGTEEDAAMARARAEASNAATFQAMQQGQQEMMNQGQLASMFGGLGNQTNQLGMAAYEGSFLPFQNQLQAMQVGQNNANLAQTGQMTGANLAAQLGLGGIQSQINAETAANNLFSNLFGSSMNALSGAAGTGLEQGVEDFLGSAASGIFNWAKGLI
jgi:hypothetical protein